MSARDVALCRPVRTAIGTFNGTLKDTPATELGAAAEWTHDRGLVRVGYDGSFFRNDNQTLVWDNPLRVTDSPTLGPVQGRESIWPNSNLNAASVSVRLEDLASW